MAIDAVMTEKRGRRLWEPAALLSSNSFLTIASKIMRSTRNGAQGTQRAVCQPISTILEQAVRNLLHGTHPNIVNRNAAAVFRSDILTGAQCVLRELEP